MSGRKIVILMGAPGAGKGTQARTIMGRLGIPQISTGDMFRDAIARKTPVGLEAKKKVDAGEYVSDDIVNEIVADRIQQPDCKKGFILDGYPRTVYQAETFSKMMATEDQLFVIEIAVDTTRLVDRLMSRWICSKCGDIYNMNSLNPKQEGVCDRCGGKLMHRSDDQENLINERLEKYRAETYPLVNHYKKLGAYHYVNGARPITQVTDEILSLIDGHAPLTPTSKGRDQKFA